MRDYVEKHPETVQDLELASEDRLWEGLELLASGQTAGGMYLLGYVAEMVLKNACFLFEGARPSDPISARLGPMRAFGKSHFPTIDRENYHSLVFWYHALLHKRNLAGRSLPSPTARQLGRRVASIHSMWVVAMRYYPAALLLPSHAATIYNDVIWLYDHRLQLRM